MKSREYYGGGNYDNMLCNEVLLHNPVYNSTVVDFQRNLPFLVCEKKKETNVNLARSVEEEKAFLGAKYAESNLNRNVRSEASLCEGAAQGAKVCDKEGATRM